MIEAQAMPKPMMGMKTSHLFVRCGKTSSPTAARTRHAEWTILAPRRRAKATSANATEKVTMLYQPLTSPVHPTASLKASDVSSLVPQIDLASEAATNCQ